MPEKIYKMRGELIKVKARKDGTQWGVYEFFNLDKKTRVTATGNLYPHNIGSIFELEGEAKYNDRFKEWQFVIKQYKLSEELSLRGIVNYLQREGPNIGESRAELIAKKFGSQTFTVLREQPELVAKTIPGFTLERATKVAEWLKKEQKLLKLKESLYGIDLTENQIGKIISHFGVKAPEVIKTDCFQLTQIDGIGFKSAAKIADKIGISKTDPKRLQAGILYALQELMDEGHVCATHHQLIQQACILLGVHKEAVIEQAKHLITTNQLLTENSDPQQFSKHSELFQEVRHERQQVPEGSVTY